MLACSFFVVANAVACGYSLLAIIVPLTSPAARFVLMADVVSNNSFNFCDIYVYEGRSSYLIGLMIDDDVQIVGMLLTGAIGAAGAISDLGKNGNIHAFWQPICGLVDIFCHRVAGALISSLVAVILCFLALMYSIYTLTKPPSTTEERSQPPQP